MLHCKVPYSRSDKDIRLHCMYMLIRKSDAKKINLLDFFLSSVVPLTLSHNLKIMTLRLTLVSFPRKIYLTAIAQLKLNKLEKVP